MREHEKNAKYLAEFLSQHEKVARVYYPGLEGTKDYEIASRQMRGFGGMLSFEIKGGVPAVERFLSGLMSFFGGEFGWGGVSGQPPGADDPRVPARVGAAEAGDHR